MSVGATVGASVAAGRVAVGSVAVYVGPDGRQMGVYTQISSQFTYSVLSSDSERTLGTLQTHH